MKHTLYLLGIFFVILLLNSCRESIKVEPKLSNTLNGTYQFYLSGENEKEPAVLEATLSNITSHSYDFAGTLTFNNTSYQLIGKETVNSNDIGLVSYLTPQDRLIGSDIEATLSLLNENLFLLCGYVFYRSLVGSFPEAIVEIFLYEYTEEGCIAKSASVGIFQF